MAAVTAVPALTARVAVRGRRVAAKANKASPVARCVTVRAQKAEDKAAAAAAFTLLMPSAAVASEFGEDLRSFVDSVDSAFDAVEGAYGVAADVAGKAAGIVEKAAPIAAPVVERAGKAAAPVADAAAKLAQRTVVPAAEQAAGVVASKAGEVTGAAAAAIKEQGVDVAPVVGVAKAGGSIALDAAAKAKPLALSAFDFLSTASPTQLVETGLAVAAFYIFSPTLLELIVAVARGYNGEVGAVMAYDNALQSGKIAFVDVRRENDVISKGEIDLPRRASGKVYSIAREQLKGSFKSVGETEAKLTALKIAALKGLGKGQTVYVLDQNGSDAPAIAKALSAQGFGKVFVVKGGFNGWTQAGLSVKSSSRVRAEIVGSPFSLPGSSSAVSGRVIDVSSPRGLLPPGN